MSFGNRTMSPVTRQTSLDDAEVTQQHGVVDATARCLFLAL